MEQRTSEWHQARLGKVTASRVSDVMAKPETATFANYQAQLIAERLSGLPTEGFTSGAMQWGVDQEPHARTAYELVSDHDVSLVGFVDHPDIKMSGASPDGLVGKEGLVEIKCPNTATHIRLLDTDRIEPKYMRQMYWQMACTGASWCDFVSYDPRLSTHLNIKIIRVDRDEKIISDIQESVAKFINQIEEKIKMLSDRYEQ